MTKWCAIPPEKRKIYNTTRKEKYSAKVEEEREKEEAKKEHAAARKRATRAMKKKAAEAGEKATAAEAAVALLQIRNDYDDEEPPAPVESPRRNESANSPDSSNRSVLPLERLRMVERERIRQLAFETQAEEGRSAAEDHRNAALMKSRDVSDKFTSMIVGGYYLELGQENQQLGLLPSYKPEESVGNTYVENGEFPTAHNHLSSNHFSRTGDSAARLPTTSRNPPAATKNTHKTPPSTPPRRTSVALEADSSMSPARAQPACTAADSPEKQPPVRLKTAEDEGTPGRRNPARSHEKPERYRK